MEFTPRETKMIKRLRKQERKWETFKKVYLFLGSISVVAYPIMMCSVLKLAGDFSTEMRLSMLAMFFPMLLIGMVIGGMFITLAIRDWNGNTTRTLLLKLIDHCNQEERQK